MNKVYAAASGFGILIQVGAEPFRGRFFYHKVRRLFRTWRDTHGRTVELPPFKKLRNRTFYDTRKQVYKFTDGGTEYTITAYPEGTATLSGKFPNGLQQDYFPAVEIEWTGGCRPVY